MLKLNVEETIAQKMKKKKMIIQVPVLSFSFPPNYSAELKMLKKEWDYWIFNCKLFNKKCWGFCFTVSIRSFKKSRFGIITHISKVRNGVSSDVMSEALSHFVTG